MTRINAVSLTYDVKDWMTNSSQPRILHVFDSACNLINERRKILSIVSPQIGNGPFNLVIEDDLLFSGHLRLESPVSVSIAQLILGNLTVSTGDATIWNPRPDWEVLYTKKTEIINQIASSSFVNHKLAIPVTLLSTFITSIVNADIPSSLVVTQKLAGLGQGLTPAGDDFMMGAIYGAWVIHPYETASTLTNEIANTAIPLTTSLSAAWLRSAGKGEAGIVWHEFLDALNHANSSLQPSISRLLAVGETSGADALAGFIGVCAAYKERIIE